MGGNCLEQSQSACTTSINRLLSGICCTTNILKCTNTHLKKKWEAQAIVFCIEIDFYIPDTWFEEKNSNILRLMNLVHHQHCPCCAVPHLASWGRSPSTHLWFSLSQKHTHPPSPALAFHGFSTCVSITQSPPSLLFSFTSLNNFHSSSPPSLSVFKCFSAFV